AASGSARAPAATPATPAAVPAGAVPGAGPAEVLRKNWDAVLEAVRRERRVAWILLSDTSVVSVQDGILTLRFAKEGDLKRFSTSDYDADLKRVLSNGFGLKVMVKGVVGEGDAASGAQSRRPASPPAFAAPRAAPLDDGPPDDGPPDDGPPDEMMPDDLPPEEFLAGGAASGPAELTGMDLIQRELGGQVISEIED
ncbi:MAG: hypothetical protein ACRDOU_08860, partial [Streptosporangiaceae bacterium]